MTIITILIDNDINRLNLIKFHDKQIICIESYRIANKYTFWNWEVAQTLNKIKLYSLKCACNSIKATAVLSLVSANYKAELHDSFSFSNTVISLCPNATTFVNCQSTLCTYQCIKIKKWHVLKEKVGTIYFFMYLNTHTRFIIFGSVRTNTRVYQGDNIMWIVNTICYQKAFNFF
jgi:hypothetical protein